jgi:CMP-N-acetylneuraminic acid synthetase
MHIEKVNFLIPMKGHSERVPNKNRKPFAGIPLYHHIVNAVSKCKYLNKIYINTDSEWIANDVADNFPHVQIINRPQSLCGDFVSMNKILEYDLSLIEGELFLQTHSTNPLLKTETIDRAIECFYENRMNNDSLFSVTRWQTRFYWQNGEPVNHNPEELLRTQDLPPIYEENSNFYIFTKESFRNANSRRIGIKPYLFEMDPLEAVDIDTEFNFKIAETIYSLLK